MHEIESDDLFEGLTDDEFDKLCDSVTEGRDLDGMIDYLVDLMLKRDRGEDHDARLLVIVARFVVATLLAAGGMDEDDAAEMALNDVSLVLREEEDGRHRIFITNLPDAPEGLDA
jgi:hypothetical protein